MQRAELMTQWHVNSELSPQVIEDHPSIFQFEDVTGQDGANLPPPINLYNVKIVADEATMDAIESDNNYYILWVEDV